MNDRPRPAVLVQAEHRAAAHVLLVEDSDLNRLITTSILEKARFQVEVAQNGLEAVLALRQGRRFDIILMDLDMPVMDGFEAIAAIRALGNACGGDTPIVALSVFGHDAWANADMNGYLAKPYVPARLVEEITQTLRRVTEPEEFPDATPIWNRRRYADLVRRLGAVKVSKHLATAMENFRVVMSKLLSDPDDAGMLAWEAHGLISPAGVLGFEDLTTVCRQAQVVGTAASCRPQSLALAAAIGRALMAVPDAEASA